MTAAAMLESLTAAGIVPTVDGGELVLATDPPDALAAALAVLHTGVVALLLGRTWWGLDPKTGRSVPLDPRQRIPRAVGLLAVGREPGWDRIHPLAFLDLPHLFTGPRHGTEDSRSARPRGTAVRPTLFPSPSARCRPAGEATGGLFACDPPPD